MPIVSSPSAALSSYDPSTAVPYKQIVTSNDTNSFPASILMQTENASKLHNKNLLSAHATEFTPKKFAQISPRQGQKSLFPTINQKVYQNVSPAATVNQNKVIPFTNISTMTALPRYSSTSDIISLEAKPKTVPTQGWQIIKANSTPISPTISITPTFQIPQPKLTIDLPLSTSSTTTARASIRSPSMAVSTTKTA